MPNIPSNSSESWSAFLDEITSVRKELDCYGQDGCEAWFRGHTRADYKLLPSLYRAFPAPISGSGAEAEEGEDEIYGCVIDKESDLFWEFSARAREIHGVLEQDWDILFAMQHYGTPTRLLDWTETLAVALYFAVLGVDETKPVDDRGNQIGEQNETIPPPCMWVLNPYKLNEYSWPHEGEADMVAPVNLGWDEDEGEYYTYSDLLGVGGMDWAWPVSIYPRQRNARIHAQQAWFTIHGDERLPLEEVPYNQKYLRPVRLEFSAIPEARNFLELAGINPYLLFSDLESLSLHLQERNGLITKKQADAKMQARNSRRDVVGVTGATWRTKRAAKRSLVDPKGPRR